MVFFFIILCLFLSVANIANFKEAAQDAGECGGRVGKLWHWLWKHLFSQLDKENFYHISDMIARWNS